MSEELTPYDKQMPKMSRKQVLASIERAKGNMIALRDELLAMFEGKAHEVMECDSFVEFAQAYMGINTSESTIKRHLAAARVERHLCSSQSQRGVIMTPVPLIAAVELARLPPADVEGVYNDWLGAKQGKNAFTPIELKRDLSRLVNAKLKANKAKEQAETIEEHVPDPEPLTRQDQMAGRANRFTPIEAETYDRGPEFDDEPVEEEKPERKISISGIYDEEWAEAHEEELEAATAVPAETHEAAEVKETVSEMECRFTILESFLLTFIKHFDSSDNNAMLELYMDAKAYKRKYEL